MFDRDLETEDDEDFPSHDFLLATCPAKMGLWYIDNHGIMKEVSEYRRALNYLCIGSGAEKTIAYIKGLLDDDSFYPESVTISGAIRIVDAAIKRARRDPATGGPLDYVILTEREGVDYGGERMRRALNAAHDKDIEATCRKYDGLFPSGES
jgi:20S proteasome alpha/beta subunit